MIQLNLDDYGKFQDYFLEYQKLFGLTDWRVSFSLSSTDIECFAQVHVNYTGKCVDVELNRFPNVDCFEPIDLRRTAFHEACEILLADFTYVSLRKEIPDNERADLVEAETHAIINRLLRAFKIIE